MMKTLVLLFAIAVTAGLGTAQTNYDPVDYFMLTAGSWRIDDDRVPGQGPSGRYGLVVTKLGQYTLHNNFEWRNNNWFPDEIDYWEVTPNELRFHGSRHPITGDFAVFNPPIRLPRTMRVGDAVHQKLTVITPQGSQTVSFTALLSADGITQTVKAGTFNNCIRMQFAFLTDQLTETQIEIRAKNAGVVWSLESDLDATEPEPSMASATITERAQP